MTKSKIKLFIGLFALFMVASLIALICFFFNESQENTVVFAENGEINRECVLYETIELGDYDFNDGNDKIIATEYSLIYPDGNERTGRKHTLSIAGEYTAKFSAIVDNKYYNDEQKFIVKENLYSSTGKKSGAFYGVSEGYESSPEGLVVSIAPYEEIKFNKIVNLSGKTKNDKIIAFYITPNQKGTFDASNLVIRFTDVYDATNYVDVTYRCLFATREWAKYHTYIVAQSAGNVAVGGKHKNNIYGYPTLYQNFVGLSYQGHGVGNPSHNIAFDYENRQVWTSLPAASEKELSANGNYIADLDDASIFPRPWKGFTTGEVYVSVFANAYQSTSMNIVLTYLDGYDLTEQKFVDTGKPKIDIDFNGELSAPSGLVNERYKLFNAVALDDYDGKVEVNANVYLMYGTTGQVNVYCKDGYFLPAVEGNYTIEYVAKDKFGNTEIKTINVPVYNKTASNVLDFNTALKVTTGISGTKIKAIDAFDVQNAKGNFTVVAKAVLNNDISITLDEDYTFTPLYSGDYEIKISLSDYVETVEKSLGRIKVSANNNPVFAEDAVIVPYFINGQTYSIAEQYGYDLSGGVPESIKAKTFIKQDNGQEVELNGKFTVNAENTITVIYRLTNKNDSIDRAREFKVINAVNNDGDLDVSKYYSVVRGDADVVVDDKLLTIKAQEDCLVDFVNAVQCEEFVINFEWYTENNEFDEFVMHLTDSVDKKTQVDVSFKWINDSLNMRINDGNYIGLPKSNTAATNQFKLIYKNENKQIGPSSTLMIDVLTALNGDVFKGFTSNLVYVSFEMKGVTVAAEINLTGINNQSMFLFEAPDFMEPEIFVKKSNGDVKLGETVKIYGARGYDVLSSSVTSTLQVISPSKKVVVAKDGTRLDVNCDASKDYEIAADEYGIYTVTYEITDSVGNVKVYYYGFSVIDMEAPQIVVNTNTSSIKLGDELKIREYTVSDNVVGKDEINVFVYVMKPNYISEGVTGNVYVPTERGVYYVYYYCYDKNNNVAVVNYKVIVQ